MFTNEISQETNMIQSFYNEVFKDNVRGRMINGEPYVSGADIARCLGYSNVWDALAKHVNEYNKVTLAIREGIPGNPNMTFINEAGVNDLILGSRMPKAQELKSWITGTVMPNIRKFSAHLEPDKADQIIEDPYSGVDLALALKESQKKNEMLQEQNRILNNTNSVLQGRINEMKPREEVYGYLMESASYCNTTTIAANYGMDVRLFNQLLASHAIQYKGDDCWHLNPIYEGLGYTVYQYGYDEYGNKFKYMAWTNRGVEFLYEVLQLWGLRPIVQHDTCPFRFTR